MDTGTDGVVTRCFESDDDFRRVRSLLGETHRVTPLDFNWDVRRWDGWRYYRDSDAWDPRWRDRVRLWETADGRVVGAVHSEGLGDACFQVHLDWRHLEEDMIHWAETHLAVAAGADRGADVRRDLRTFAFEDDGFRIDLLERRGWTRTSSGGVVRRLFLGSEPSAPEPIADGYRLRTTRTGAADAQRIADLLNSAFRRDFHTAAEYEVFVAHAASFRRETDLVAEAADASFAAYVGAPFDEPNRRGILEPVCTHPSHQRRGLARSLVREALRRLGALGASEVTVGTGDSDAANRFYDSLGFTEMRSGWDWRFGPPLP